MRCLLEAGCVFLAIGFVYEGSSKSFIMCIMKNCTVFKNILHPDFCSIFLRAFWHVLIHTGFSQTGEGKRLPRDLICLLGSQVGQGETLEDIQSAVTPHWPARQREMEAQHLLHWAECGMAFRCEEGWPGAFGCLRKCHGLSGFQTAQIYFSQPRGREIQVKGAGLLCVQ